jgi:hypothetical protein
MKVSFDPQTTIRTPAAAIATTISAAAGSLSRFAPLTPVT